MFLKNKQNSLPFKSGLSRLLDCPFSFRCFGVKGEASRLAPLLLGWSDQLRLSCGFLPLAARGSWSPCPFIVSNSGKTLPPRVQRACVNKHSLSLPVLF